MFKNKTTELIVKTGINFIKTTAIILVSNVVQSELKATVKETNEMLFQNKRLWINKAKNLTH
jgi:hypothetical protein